MMSTFEELTGYKSLYSRLENKLAVENKLSPEKKEKIEGMFFVADAQEQERIKEKYINWVKGQKAERLKISEGPHLGGYNIGSGNTGG